MEVLFLVLVVLAAFFGSALMSVLDTEKHNARPLWFQRVAYLALCGVILGFFFLLLGVASWLGFLT